MKRLILFVLLFAASAIFVASNSYAQLEGEVILDTVGNTVYTDGRIQDGVNPRIMIRFHNTTGERTNISTGFKVTSPDGAVWDSITVDSCGPVSIDGENTFYLYFNQVIAVQGLSPNRPGDGPPADTFGILGAGSPTSGSRQMPINFNDTVMALIIWLDPAGVNHLKHICIDSAVAQDELWTWKWVTRTLVDRFPTFTSNVDVPYEPNGGANRYGSGFCLKVQDPAVGVDDNPTLPNKFSVSDNYPNPFNPSTTIDYSVPRKSKVNLSVYNVLGQRVATLVDQEMAAGKYRAVWDGKADNGSTLSSGIYFYKFEAENFVKTSKMVMLK